MAPAALDSPGVIVENASPLADALHLGRYPSGGKGRASQIAADLHAAGFASEVVPDVMRMKYRKLLANLGNALDALTGEWLGTDPLARARAEAEACFEAAGIDVQSADEERAMGNPDVVRIRGRDWSGSSSRQSLARGAGSIESDYLNGEVVLRGACTECQLR